jgi:hypothetical protein
MSNRRKAAVLFIKSQGPAEIVGSQCNKKMAKGASKRLSSAK